jgi:hypothetical protein
MGLTIHFKGQLKGLPEYRELIEIAKTTADDSDWPNEPIYSENARLLRVTDDERDWDYKGAVSGIVLHPHPDAEPLRLEFDTDLYVQEYIKTQFAGEDTHVAVIRFLRKIEPLFLNLLVNDEAEYWETNDRGLLRKNLAHCQKAISEAFATYTDAKMMVRSPDGRIVDIIHYDE